MIIPLLQLCRIVRVKVQRYSASEKKSSSVPQPQIIKAYNYNMGGTDRQDQNVSYYRTSIRSKKWWWPIFYGVWTSLHKIRGSYTGNLTMKKWSFLHSERQWQETYFKNMEHPNSSQARTSLLWILEFPWKSDWMRKGIS